MKSVLIIGLGRFGHHLCIDMANRGNEVMVIDKDEKKTPDLLEYATAVRVGDCTNEEVLRSLGVGNFDLCFVCIGSNFQSSLEITSLVKELGAKHVVSKANRDIHAKFLLRNGADEVFYPDRDIAERLAVKYSANHVLTILNSVRIIRFLKSTEGCMDRTDDRRSGYKGKLSYKCIWNKEKYRGGGPSESGLCDA